MNSPFPMPESLAKGRSLLAFDVPAARRKQLGQYFTGLRTGRLLAALAVREGQRRIVDPMAGRGDLIEFAAERAQRICPNREELVGVEIEPEAARLGQWRVEQCAREFGFARAHFVRRDTFAVETWDNFVPFDLVIANPPYVRYQTLSNGGAEGGTKLLNTEATREALERLAVKLAPPEEHLVWRRLIRSYSGLSDLSVPCWLLCGLLTAPSGILALIVPQSWLNRDYARIARYFFLRFFTPLTVVQESGQRWFQDALIPVALVVGQRLSAADALIPLVQRQGRARATSFVEINSLAASDHSHVGNAFQSDDPEREFAEWVERGNGRRTGIALEHVPWDSQRDQIVVAVKSADWFRRLEGESSTRNAKVLSSTALPPSIAHHLPSAYLSNTGPLSSQAIRVGQGLRTGCNAFFYVEALNESNRGETVSVITHELFGKRQIDVSVVGLKPVLRKQSELSSIRINVEALRGRLLDLRTFLRPEQVASLNPARGTSWYVMPEALAEYVRLAARTYFVRGDTRKLIPSLSAVKSNGLGPDEEARSPFLLKHKVPRMWYMIPDFAPRHLAALCVPRIIHGNPQAILNSDPPVLIDANFSTLWCEGGGWSAETVFAILNSTWGELCMEALGATLGGGALKLEATHLRRLPIPAISHSQKEKLGAFVSKLLEMECSLNELRQHRFRIDEIIISALLQRKVARKEAIACVEKLTAMIRSLRAKRRRK